MTFEASGWPRQVGSLRNRWILYEREKRRGWRCAAANLGRTSQTRREGSGRPRTLQFRGGSSGAGQPVLHEARQLFAR